MPRRFSILEYSLFLLHQSEKQSRIFDCALLNIVSIALAVFSAPSISSTRPSSAGRMLRLV